MLLSDVESAIILQMATKKMELQEKIAIIIERQLTREKDLEIEI